MVVSRSPIGTVLVTLLLTTLHQVECGHVFFPESNEAVDTTYTQATQEHLNVHHASSESRGLFPRQAQEDISLNQDGAIEQENPEDSPEARGLWESDLFFLQKLSGLFGGDDTPKRKRVRPQNLRPGLLPPSLAHRRNGLQNPHLHNKISGQPTPLRHPTDPANTLRAPHWDAQQEESNRIAVRVPPQPKPIRPTENIQNVAPEESFPYQFVRPDQPGASTDKRKPIKKQPSAPVIRRQQILMNNKFSGTVPKPLLLNGPDPSRNTVLVQNQQNSQIPNSIYHIGSLNAPSSIPIPPPQQVAVPQTINGLQSQTNHFRHPVGGPVLRPTPPQPFQSFKVSSSLDWGNDKQKVQNLNLINSALPPKNSFLSSQIDPALINQRPLVNKPALTKKPAMSFLDSLASMAGSVTNVLNPKQPKKKHPRPAPNPQRVFHEVQQPTQTSLPPFNPSLQFNPSPQEGNSLLSDAFQPVFIASPSLDGELDRNLMKPISVGNSARSPEVDTSSSPPELVDFF